MKKLLIVVDMQNDFIDGSLGTAEAQKIVPNVCKKIREWEGDILCTRDTHEQNYLQTREGRYLPVEHCILGTEGHEINSEVNQALHDSDYLVSVINKNTFGSTVLPSFVAWDANQEIYDLECAYDYIELVGLCTDICVVSNAMLLKATYPETDIAVDASCCAGVTPESHNAALTTMRMCQIDIKGE